MSSPAFTIRPFLPGEDEVVRKLVYTVLIEYGLTPEDRGTDADLADICANYLDRGGVFQVVVDAGDRVVGCGGLYPLSHSEVELRKMYLLPEMRGRGAGRALLEELIAHARRLGFAKVVLETASVLREAIGLYRSFGFTATTRAHLVRRCDQAYELDLAPGNSLVQHGTERREPLWRRQ